MRLVKSGPISQIRRIGNTRTRKKASLDYRGLDQHRYLHLRRISRKRWLCGKPVKGDHSNRELWQHVHRMNRKQAKQLRGKINQRAREKVFTQGTVTVEVNAHGTSQYCSRCGAKGERFSLRGGCRIKERWGKLFWCSACHYEANVHHSFYRKWHWQSFPKPPPKAKASI